MRRRQREAEAPASTIDAPAKDAVDEAQGPRPGREGSRFVDGILPQSDRPIPDPDDWTPEGMRAWAEWLDREEAATSRRVEHLLAARYGEIAARGEISQDALSDVLDALSRDGLAMDELRRLVDGLRRRRGRAPRRWVS